MLPLPLVLGTCWARALVPLPDEGAGRRARVLAQLRFLHRATAEDGAAERMQGMFPEGACFMHTLPALAWANIAREEPALRPEALAAIRTSIDGLAAPAAVRPFADTEVRRGVFWLGQRTLLLLEHCALAPPDARDPDLEAELHANCAALASAFLASPTHHLRTLPGHAWPADNVAALVALAEHARLYGTGHRAAFEAWRTWTEAHLDAETLLPHGEVDARTGAPRDVPRGCATSWVLPLVARVDPALARVWYDRYRHHFGIERLGLRMFREWPVGRARAADVDSGPVLLGAGVAATGIGLAAARSVGDTETARDIDTLAEFFGCPLQVGDERSVFLGQFAVGDAFLAYARSIPLPTAAHMGGASRVVSAWPFHLVCAVTLALLAWRIVRVWRARLRRGRDATAG